MKIGVIKEGQPEKRVALTPEGVQILKIPASAIS